jgi:two-component system sensor histidine kinase AlgZ
MKKIKNFFNSFLRRTKTIFFGIGQNMPYIPNFHDVWNIMKVFSVSFLICIIYSFSKIYRASDIFFMLEINLKAFTPYVITMLLFLYFSSSFLKRINPFFALCWIFVLNIISVYFVFSSINRDFFLFFYNPDVAFDQLAVSIGILFFFLMYFDWREKNLDPANVIAKLTFLQSKMRPHFLFNTLNSVNSLIKRDPEKARKMINNLSELLRMSIKDEDVKEMYELKNEINLCEKYLEIEKVRLGERLQVNWNINNNCILAKVPKLFLQPIIENAVLHGIQNLEIPGVIEVSLHKNLNEKLIIEVKNPYPLDLETKNSKDIKGNNISIPNIKERLNIYYQGDIDFKITKEKGFHYVYIEIPYIV